MQVHTPMPFTPMSTAGSRSLRCAAVVLMSAVISVLMLTFANDAAAAGTPDATGTPPATSSQSKIVRIDNFSFTPPRLEVPVGSTVTWENHDDMPHTVVHDAHPADFSSPPLDTDDKFSYRFTKPGTYAYYCSMHPRMTGVIIVK